MGKTKREYQKVFEDLMQYTRFKSVKDIKTREDLVKFFSDIKDDNPNFRSSALFGEFNKIVKHPFSRIRVKSPRAKQIKVVFKSKKGKTMLRFRDPKTGRFVKFSK